MDDCAILVPSLSIEISLINEQGRNMEIDKHFNRITAAEAMDKVTSLWGSFLTIFKAKELLTDNQSQAQDIISRAIDTISQSISAQDPFCQRSTYIIFSVSFY